MKKRYFVLSAERTMFRCFGAHLFIKKSIISRERNCINLTLSRAIVGDEWKNNIGRNLKYLNLQKLVSIVT